MDVKTLCLGVLTLGQASGYEIKKHFEEGPFAHFHAAGFGSIYPALNALKAEGLVTCVEMEQDGRPDKKVYSITDNGREAFRKELHRQPAPDSFRSEAIFMMFFGDLLDRDHLHHVYDDYISRYSARVDRMAQQDMADRPAGRRFVHGMGLAVYRASLAYMEQNRDLLFDRAGGRNTPTENSPHEISPPDRADRHHHAD
jgi:PadR family transcriptional regulator, regulatory protein AphA